jgi:hypothetical protein
MGNALIKVMGYEIEDIFLKVGACAADAVDLILADHFGQREAKLGGAHGAGDGDEHLATLREVFVVCFSGVNEGSGIEMAIVVLDEGCNRTHGLMHCSTP